MKCCKTIRASAVPLIAAIATKAGNEPIKPASSNATVARHA
jgi:hypothetical protein